MTDHIEDRMERRTRKRKKAEDRATMPKLVLPRPDEIDDAMRCIQCLCGHRGYRAHRGAQHDWRWIYCPECQRELRQHVTTGEVRPARPDR